MKDRIVEHPNRYRQVPVAGQPGVVDLIPEPGTVTDEGTPISVATLLKDTTAKALGLTADAVPDEALAKLKALIDANGGKINGINGRLKKKLSLEFVAYIGNKNNTKVVNFTKRPVMIFLSQRNSSQAGSPVSESIFSYPVPVPACRPYSAAFNGEYLNVGWQDRAVVFTGWVDYNNPNAQYLVAAFCEEA